MDKKTKTQQKNRKNNKNSNDNITVSTWLWRAFGAFILASILFIGLIWTGIIGYIPPIDDLENPIDQYASQVISADNNLLFTFSKSDGNRVYVDYLDLSPYLEQALVSTEDVRFYRHSGIDVIGLGRAIVKTILLGQKESGGGSTIAQQLAKQLYTPRAKNKIQRMFQKPVEWVIALKLERFYTKEEIINLYLNYFPFIYDADGIDSASRIFFNKKPKDLKVEEAAMLVGMLKNPTTYNPVRKPEQTKERRNVVLSQMEKAGHLTETQKDSLQNLPLGLDFNRDTHIDIPAPYYRQHLAKIMMAKKPEKKNYASWQEQQFIEDSYA
ncbi:MAG: transglycosylase domain-containing protein, partial [Dysgonamonadaceae bacterium]|nr:transglycosylase domain-containing protein [Dysgonamonadaceae bacterium]